VGVVANASSGTGQGRVHVLELVRSLRRSGIRSKIAWTPAARTQLVAEAGRDDRCRCLVAVGGDGTVGALVNECPSVPITVLPAGTENLFARHFGLDRDPVKLAQTIVQNRLFPLDLGLTGSTRFTLMAGLGFDADIVSRHHFARIRLTGKARPTHRGMYVEPVVRSSMEYNFPKMTATIGDNGTVETLTGTSIFIFNLPNYALGLPFAPEAKGNDGLLDLVVFPERGPINALKYLALVVLRRHLMEPGVEHRKIRKVTITSNETVPVQLDGDPGGRIEVAPGGAGWSAEVLPAAVRVVVPESYTV
jgi:diacylglycerol kinase family enzyme